MSRRLCMISFTQVGMKLAERLKDCLCDGMVIGIDDIHTYTKCSELSQQDTYVDKKLSSWTKERLEEKSALLFIGACGIAVRAVAPFLTDKLQDSPVLVMDEKGQYIIPILSGHVGGANEIANWIAQRTGAIPVITTATDLHHTFAVDVFARKNELSIKNKEGIAKVSSKLLAQGQITMSVARQEIGQVPTCIQLIPYPPKETVDVLITAKDWQEKALLLLQPKEYVIGIGCKKGKEPAKLESFVTNTLKENGLQVSQIAAIASIELKREEPALQELSKKWQVPFVTYSADELAAVEGNFHASFFVEKTVGVDNVCERAALKDANELVYEKHQQDGMTIAIAKRKWRITFE